MAFTSWRAAGVSRPVLIFVRFQGFELSVRLQFFRRSRTGGLTPAARRMLCQYSHSVLCTRQYSHRLLCTSYLITFDFGSPGAWQETQVAPSATCRCFVELCLWMSWQLTQVVFDLPASTSRTFWATCRSPGFILARAASPRSTS